MSAEKDSGGEDLAELGENTFACQVRYTQQKMMAEMGRKKCLRRTWRVG